MIISPLYPIWRQAPSNAKLQSNKGKLVCFNTQKVCSKTTLLHRKVVLLHNKVSLLYNKVTLLHNKVTLLHNKVSLLHNKVTLLHNKVSLLHNKVTLLHNKVTLLHNKVTLLHRKVSLLHSKMLKKGIKPCLMMHKLLKWHKREHKQYIKMPNEISFGILIKQGLLNAYAVAGRTVPIIIATVLFLSNMGFKPQKQNPTCFGGVFAY